MKSKIIFAFGLLFITSIASAATENYTGHALGHLGVKSLNSDDWGKLDDQLAVGASLDFRRPSWPINLALEMIYSADSHESRGVETEVVIAEFAGGVKKYFALARSLDLYVGGGPTIISASMDAATDENDLGIGIWLGTGLLVNLGERFVVGGGLRYSTGDVELFDKNRDAGGMLVHATGGVRF